MSDDCRVVSDVEEPFSSLSVYMESSGQDIRYFDFKSEM